MITKALIADIDNTLFDWPAFFAPSFRAMVHALEKRLDLSYAQLESEFKRVYSEKDSLEYSFSIQELESVRLRNRAEIDDIIRTGRGAFRRVSKLRLQVYPGVKETLAWAKNQGHLVICVTNSPAYLAQKRLFDLRIDKFVDCLIAWEGVDLNHAEHTDYNEPRILRSLSSIANVKTFSKQQSKPSTKPFELALQVPGVSPECAWSIGDSVSKDLAPAAQLGIKTIWARYGSIFDPSSKDAETLLSITNWSDEEIKATHSQSSHMPNFVIDRFADIRQILPETQPDLFQTV